VAGNSVAAHEGQRAGGQQTMHGTTRFAGEEHRGQPCSGMEKPPQERVVKMVQEEVGDHDIKAVESGLREPINDIGLNETHLPTQ
jgi:hypothetical protein